MPKTDRELFRQYVDRRIRVVQYVAHAQRYHEWVAVGPCLRRRALLVAQFLFGYLLGA